MDIFDEMIRAGLRRDLAGHQPPAKVWEQVRQGVKGRAPYPYQWRLVGLAVALFVGLAALLPGPRAVASELAKQLIFVNLDSLGLMFTDKKVEPVAVLEVSPGAKPQIFEGGPGQLPPEGVEAAQAKGLPLLVPGWLPEGLPIRLDVNEKDVLIWIGNEITVRQTAAPAGEAVGLPAKPEVISTELIVVDSEGARTEVQSHLRYKFTVTGVAITINGPLDSEAVLSQLAESLVTQ